jgi:hypothetical protein
MQIGAIAEHTSLSKGVPRSPQLCFAHRMNQKIKNVQTLSDPANR